MDDLILRRATLKDMDSILKLQVRVFEGEQGIPASLVPISEENAPKWWCAYMAENLVGAVAAWDFNTQMHLGRYAIRPEYRGQHIGTRLAQFAIEDLFSQAIDQLYIEARDITVKIISKMGGEVVGDPSQFYNGMVTPMILSKANYRKAKQTG